MTACAPQTKIVPPQARTVPQASANRGRNWCLPLLFSCFLWTGTGFHDIFGMKTFFFLFGDHLFSAEKTLEFAILDGKSLWIFGLHLVHLIQTGINFSCPRAPLEFTQINFSCPPKIYFCPPSQAILAPGLTQPWLNTDISGYTFVHIDSPTTAGGVAMYTGWPISKYTVIARKSNKNFFIGGIYFISSHNLVSGT